MALVTKNDVTQIFAIQAPEVDLPPTFANYPRGWDTARANNGKPTIKQFNYIQQRTDQNVLWIHQNGAALPYDATMEYAENAHVVKDGELQKKQGAGWVPAANKGYNLDYFVSGKSYPLHAEIMLDNGDIVKSTVANNIINPNVDMTGWVKTNSASQLNYSLLKNKITRSIYEKLYETWSVKDFGAIGDGTLHTLQEWVTQGKFSNLTAIQFVFPFVTSLTESIDCVAIQAAIKALPLNTTDVGILTPKGFANGGCIFLPRGRYVIDKKVTMQRGLRLCGESRESSQLISLIPDDSVLQYTDVGRYIQDEIVIQNLSIWQDPNVVATAGAGIDVIEGAASVQSLYLNLDNVYIEGTFYGVRHMAGVGGGVSNSNISKCVSHGIYLTGSVSTTSMAFSNTYCHQNGGYGYVVERGAYITWTACASDSNGLGGYHINQTRCYEISGSGAEANQGPAVKLTSAGGGSIDVFAIANTGGVIDAGTAQSDTVYAPSGDWEGDGFAVRGSGNTPVHLGRGLILRGEYAANRVAYQANTLDESQQAKGKLVGGLANRWAIGSTQQPEPDTTFTVGGLADTGTTVGLKSVVQHGTAGNLRNVCTYSQFRTQDTAITYKIGIGHFIPNSSKGESSVIEKSAGEYIVEQTQGSIANANLMIDGGQGSVPAGNWSIYNGSARPNYYGGSIQSALGFGAFGVAPPTTKRSITGKKVPTTIAEQNIVIDSIVSALAAYGFVSDDRT